MNVLFTQSWDPIPGKHDEYSNFISLYYNPTLERLGLHLVGGYYVVVGEGPRIIAVATVKDMQILQQTLLSQEYQDINNKLLQYVWKYTNKILVPYDPEFNPETYQVQIGVWRFNIYYNVLRSVQDQHHQFLKEEFIPEMERLKLPVTSVWRMTVGSGPRMLLECTGKNFVNIAKAIDTVEYRKIIRTIREKHVTDYSSRILAPTGKIEVPYLTDSMLKKF
ncbi:MAG TPA: hypothetical protein VKN82_03775 [Desulfohalobiaceae bacterium]|nr:hypothetical protein [Desulfohalobiaceae bacterium]